MRFLFYFLVFYFPVVLKVHTSYASQTKDCSNIFSEQKPTDQNSNSETDNKNKKKGILQGVLSFFSTLSTKNTQNSEYSEVWAVIRELTRAQQETDKKIDRLVEHSKETDKKIDRLVEHSKETDKKIEDILNEIRELFQTTGGFGNAMGKLIEKFTESEILSLLQESEITLLDSEKQILKNKVLYFSNDDPLKKSGKEKEFDFIVVEKHSDQEEIHKKKRILIMESKITIKKNQVIKLLNFIKNKLYLDQLLEHISELTKELFTRDNTSVQVAFIFLQLQRHQEDAIHLIAEENGLLLMELTPRSTMRIISNPNNLQDFSIIKEAH